MARAAAPPASPRLVPRLVSCLDRGAVRTGRLREQQLQPHGQQRGASHAQRDLLELQRCAAQGGGGVAVAAPRRTQSDRAPGEARGGEGGKGGQARARGGEGGSHRPSAASCNAWLNTGTKVVVELEPGPRALSSRAQRSNQRCASSCLACAAQLSPSAKCS